MKPDGVDGIDTIDDGVDDWSVVSSTSQQSGLETEEGFMVCDTGDPFRNVETGNTRPLKRQHRSDIENHDICGDEGSKSEPAIKVDSARRFSRNKTKRERRPVLLGELDVHPRIGNQTHRMTPFYDTCARGFYPNAPWFPEDTNVAESQWTVERMHEPKQQFYEATGWRPKRSSPLLSQQTPIGTSLSQQTSIGSSFDRRQVDIRIQEVRLDSTSREDIVERISKRIIRRLEKRFIGELEQDMKKLIAVLGETGIAGTRVEHAGKSGPK